MKRWPVVFAPEAEDDLIALYDWVADRAGEATAIGYIARIEAFCTGLETAPERGHLRNDIRPGLRILGFERRLTIAISVDEHRVTILRLFYGGRDWDDML